MIPYIVLLGITILFYSMLCNVQLKGVNKGRMYIAVVTSAVVLLLGLRHPSMGVDLAYGQYYGYLASFQSIAKMSWKKVLSLTSYLNYERGYVLFNKVVGLISREEQFFLFVCAVASIVPIGLTIGKYSKNCRTSFLIYFGLSIFMVNFSALRQAIAVAITFWGFGYIKEKRLKGYILLVLVASLFHTSALISILAYPLYWINLNRSARMVTLGTLPILFLLRSTIWDFIVRITGRSVGAEHNGAVMLFLLFAAIYVYTIVFSPEKNSYSGLSNLLFVCCCILSLTEVSQIVQRVAYYYLPYTMLVLPEVLDAVRNSRGRIEYTIHTTMVAGGFVAFFLRNVYTTSWAMAYPYYFFWQNIG